MISPDDGLHTIPVANAGTWRGGAVETLDVTHVEPRPLLIDMVPPPLF